LVQSALGSSGLKIDFWKIAMRPGKPLMFGRFREIPMIGLPGNPVSALVCAILFLRPAIETLLGVPMTAAQRTPIIFGGDLPANDTREDYLRASLRRENGRLIATPFPTQDSSMLSTLANAGCLIVRAPFAPEARSGDAGEAIPLTNGPH
jgi:molybdopterin molybdotransferase